MKSGFLLAADRLDLPKILHRIQSLAVSNLGREAVHNILPCSDLAELSAIHNRVSEVRRVIESGDIFPIEGIKDIRSSIERSAVENNSLTPKELLNIGTTLSASRAIKNFIEKSKEYLPELFQITSDISIHKEIEFNIFQAVDENYEIKDSASKELKNLRREISQKQEMIRKALEKILRASSDQGVIQDEIVTTRDGRMVIPIKSDLKNKFPGFIHSTSSSGQTVFVEPSETLTLNNDICELFFKEKREIDRILRQLTSQIRAINVHLKKIIESLQELDLCYAKARYSIENKANKPLLKENGSIVINQGYHPILLLRHPRESIVPLDLEIGRTFNTLLITGPNAGGKTVTLKSVGILILMVQCGIPVPVSPDSEFPVAVDLFVLIGDNQSIENDLSTFSSHILQLKEIIDTAGGKSIVLIDEIGSNTDPSEGGAIASAVLEHLTHSGVLTIATSHQASLKAFVHNSEGMENGAMEFDQKSLLPTYRFKTGFPGSSYAFEITDRFGMDPKIVQRSREFLGDQTTRLEKMILDLENRSQLLEVSLHTADQNVLKYKGLVQEYETKLKSLNNEIRGLKKKAIDEARSIIDKASSQIENTVKEIKDQQANKDVIKKSRVRVDELQQELIKLEAELLPVKSVQEPSPAVLRDGDLVTLNSGGQVGTVIDAPDKNGNLIVAFGSIRAKVHIQSISLSENKKVKRNDVISSVSIEKSFTHEVDVRGMYGDEAEKTVDKFLDDAVLSGLLRVDIIHGKGTGALRKRIHILLENDIRIKSFRHGEWNEGGDGITVVDLA